MLLKPLIDLHGEPKNWATAAAVYLDVLADIPPELLAIAVRHALTSNPYFPKPGELRASIADELAEHRRRREAEARALLPKPAESPPPSPEDIAAVERVMADVRRNLAAKAFVMKGEDASVSA